MSNSTDKPLAGALRAAQMRRHGEDHCVGATGHPLSSACSACVLESHHIARESGLAELVEAVLQANAIGRRVGDEMLATMSPAAWSRIQAAARRVKGDA